MNRIIRSILSVSILIFLFSGISVAGEYLRPAGDVARALERPPLPEVQVSPDRSYLLLVQREGMPGIEELSRPWLALAGKRFLPENFGPLPDRNGRIVKITLFSIRDKRSRDVEIPSSVNPYQPRFSPDCKWLAFLDLQPEGISLWIAEASTGRSRRISNPELSLVTGSFFWLPDSSGIICRRRSNRFLQPPAEPRVPEGPVIQETTDVEAKVRTYQDLLKTPHDIKLFEHYFTSQLVCVSLDGRTKAIGEPGIFENVSISPDGLFLVVVRIVKPYSYLVPWHYFSREIEIWNTGGRKIKILAKLERAEEIPIGGVPTGPRSVDWRDDHPSTLVWVEALDGGDPQKDAAYRDQLMLLEPPFRGAPRQLLRTAMRFREILWGSGEWEFLFTEDRIKQWSRTWAFSVRNGELGENKLLWDRDSGDAYGDPGRLVGHYNSRGRFLIDEHGGRVLLAGTGSSPDGDHPFLDQFVIETGQSHRIFQNLGDAYEEVVDVLDSEGLEIITRHETASSPPSYYKVNSSSGNRSGLVEFSNPAPEFKGMRRETIHYLRNDGVELSGTLCLPPGWKEGEKLPLVMWAYPREYNDPGIAAQVRGSSHRFPQVSGASHLYFLLEGYAVLDGPAMPVVGTLGNDTFVEQLIMNAKAAVDKVVNMGIADKDKIAIGGHSYGAFMTANLLAHSDFFAAGIARSGAYNRTLTPFGFQNERRTFWEAPEVYFSMSPFMHANQINEPILLIHGEADSNSGTFPIQSHRMFHALKGLGATARLVVLPQESHGYVARESVMHTVYEMLEWGERFLKKK